MDFIGKHIVVTGGTSDIGKEIIKSIYYLGGSIYTADLPSVIPELNNYIEEIKESEEAMKTESWHGFGDRTIKAYELDLEDQDSIEDFTHQLRDVQIDHLVNVAGINILKDFLSWEVEDWEKIFRINAIGTFFLTQKIAEGMVQNNRGGSITFISSQHGIVANYDRIPYCMTKGLLVQMTKAIALELSHHQIRVNCISPTFVLTEKNKDFLTNSYFYKEALSHIPLNKYVKPIDIANGVVYLLSEAAAMITGHNLVMDGGWTIK